MAHILKPLVKTRGGKNKEKITTAARRKIGINKMHMLFFLLLTPQRLKALNFNHRWAEQNAELLYSLALHDYHYHHNRHSWSTSASFWEWILNGHHNADIKRLLRWCISWCWVLLKHHQFDEGTNCLSHGCYAVHQPLIKMTFTLWMLLLLYLAPKWT